MTDERDERQEEFLKKARDAEVQVTHTNDRVLQESWKRIAESYRALARSQAALNKPHLAKWRSKSDPPEQKKTLPR